MGEVPEDLSPSAIYLLESSSRFRDISLSNIRKNRCLEGQKWSEENSFLTPHLETPKDIATKRRRHVRTQLYHHLHADRRHRRRDICCQTKKNSNHIFNIRQNAYQRRVCRIIKDCARGIVLLKLTTDTKHRAAFV